MRRHDVEATLVHDRSAGYMVLPSSATVPEERVASLWIGRDDRSGPFWIRIQGHPTLFPQGKDWRAQLPLNQSRLWGAVRECQEAWRRVAVEYVDDKKNPVLQQHWDLSKRPQLCAQLLQPLAAAGATLFNAIFSTDDTDANAKRLKRIRDTLRELTELGPGWIRVVSDEYFAPWNLIYSKPLADPFGGSDADGEGFWGFRHLVEHSPWEIEPGRELNAEQPVRMSANLDKRIDDEFNVRCNAPVQEELARYEASALALQYRFDSDGLRDGWKRPPLEEQIVYFCCHAEVEGDEFSPSVLRLSDDTPITGGQLALLLEDKTFERQPIVFLNACQTGRMNSIFYEGFAKTLLGKRASAVIGTTTEMPAVFAGEFARRFFAELFEGDADGSLQPEADSQRNRVGDILFRLRRTFLDQYANPLGMLYALYQGADIALPERLSRAQSSSS